MAQLLVGILSIIQILVLLLITVLRVTMLVHQWVRHWEDVLHGLLLPVFVVELQDIQVVDGGGDDAVAGVVVLAGQVYLLLVGLAGLAPDDHGG